MSWTGAFGRGCRVLLYAIVHGLALTRINPNILTFLGLVINIVAAVLFGYATGENTQRMFLYAGLVIIGAGIFDMVDGRVARATGQVTAFGGFFDSVIDRYSDVALFFGLLVYYARANRFFYVVLVAFGSTVVVYDSTKDEKLEYKLVTSEESDVTKGLISTTSPIGRALMGKKEGDTAVVVTPNGKRELEVLKLSTIHDEA